VELPPYRLPTLGAVLGRMGHAGKAFLVRAGTLILAASVLIWALSTFPRSEEAGPSEATLAAQAAFEARTAREDEGFEAERARQEQALEAADALLGAEQAAVARDRFEAFLRVREEALDARRAEEGALERAAEAETVGERRRRSALGRMGRFVEPVFAPIGWDWKVSMAVLASFPAREVVVSTLGVIYNLGPVEDDDEEAGTALRERLQAATWEAGPRAGRKVFDLAAALAMMVFFALCAQCASTLVMIWRETGTWRWAAFTFAYMTALAWVGAFLTATIVRAWA
jgi:ferrous iron transport protein B